MLKDKSISDIEVKSSQIISFRRPLDLRREIIGRIWAICVGEWHKPARMSLKVSLQERSMAGTDDMVVEVDRKKTRISQVPPKSGLCTSNEQESAPSSPPHAQPQRDWQPPVRMLQPALLGSPLALLLSSSSYVQVYRRFCHHCHC
ncbi:hypothetical protein HJG60_009544 [Phyllostomus discolor]|uniref:Uncharacterized protein n=1 Tax=Phyllostomus discolor TaxID=89673 RepID=A0A833YHY9_9CHIR|nr:hypothetical protein HJG60_009544 [Phyllostomus discolor]